MIIVLQLLKGFPSEKETLFVLWIEVQYRVRYVNNALPLLHLALAHCDVYEAEVAEAPQLRHGSHELLTVLVLLVLVVVGNITEIVPSVYFLVYATSLLNIARLKETPCYLLQILHASQFVFYSLFNKKYWHVEADHLKEDARSHAFLKPAFIIMRVREVVRQLVDIRRLNFNHLPTPHVL